MALDAVINFGKCTVSTGYAAGAVTVVLTGGDGAKLPQPSTDGEFNLVWWNSTDYSDPSDDPNVEIVRCTARSTDTLTVTRAQEGTADVNHNTGGKNYKMCLAITKKMITDIDANKAEVTRTRIRAYSTVNQKIPTGAFEKIQLDSESYDVLGEFDSSVKTGTASATSADHLIDTVLSPFVAGDVGKTVWNTTDNTYATITVFNSTSDVTLSADIMANGEGYSIYLSRFTVTQAGYYSIGGALLYSDLADGQRYDILLYKNGSEIIQYLYTAGGANYNSIGAFDTVYLNVADYLELYTYQSGGSVKTLSGASKYTYLTIQRST